MGQARTLSISLTGLEGTLVEVEADRGELHEDVGGFTNQEERPGNDHERYRDSGDGVGTLKPGGHDEHG